MSATQRAVVHIGPEGLEATAFLECPRCGCIEELAPVNLGVELRQGFTLTRLVLVAPELPVAQHECRLDTQVDQDPQPPFMDRGGVGFCAPLVTYGDGSGSRSSSAPGAPGNAGASRSSDLASARSTTGLDARSSRSARIELPIFEADGEYWAFVQQIRARVNVGELEIDAILETAQMLSAELAEREQFEREHAAAASGLFLHPAETDEGAAASGPRANVSDVSETTGALWSGENSDRAADMQRWKDKLRDQALAGYSVPIVPFPSVHPAGRRLRAVPADPSQCTGFVPASGFGNARICQICRRPLDDHTVREQ